MMTDTITPTIRNAAQNTKQIFYPDDENKNSLFNVYLEFILYWTQSDAQSYRNASMMVSGREEKDFLLSMVTRKSEMFDTLSAQRINGYNNWYESTFNNSIQPSTGRLMLDNEFQPMQSLSDAVRFVYRKEQQSLKMFEKVRRSNLDAAIQALLESAAKYQRQFILYLKSKSQNMPEMNSTGETLVNNGL